MQTINYSCGGIIFLEFNILAELKSSFRIQDFLSQNWCYKQRFLTNEQFGYHKRISYSYPQRDPTPLENEVGSIIADYIKEATKKVKAELNKIKVVQATEFSIKEDSKVVQKVLLVYVSYPSLKIAQAHILPLIAAIEKKRSVPTFFTGKRTIQSRWVKSHKTQTRPKNRTLTAVHDAILDDLLHPANITGRRMRVRNGKTFFRM